MRALYFTYALVFGMVLLSDAFHLLAAPEAAAAGYAEGDGPL